MRPRHRSRSDNEKERVRRSPMDRGRANQIVERALAITWKWIAEDQYRDARRFRYGDERKHARDASDLIFQLNAELDLAAPRNSALNEMLERPAKRSDFDCEMLEEWLLDIVELTGTEFEKLPEAYNFIETSEVCCLHHWQADDRRIGEEPDHGAIIGAIRTKCTTPRCKLLLWVKLPGGRTSRDVLLAWDTMHPIVRSEVERRLRSESAGSIRAALIRIPILINAELEDLKATKLPHVRVLQRRLVALLRQYGLGFGALAPEHGKESLSQQFARLAQEAIGVQEPVSISRHHIHDEHRREKNCARRTPQKV